MSRSNWLILAGAGAALAIFTAGPEPWRAAAAGAFMAPDFAQDVAAARMFREGVSPYSPGFAAAHAAVMGLPGQGYPYFPHPPLVVLLVWPTAFVPFATAAAAWFGLSLGLLILLAAMLDAAVRPVTGATMPESRRVGLWFCALLLWPPVLYNLEKGQLSILLAVLIAGAWLARTRGAWPMSGALIGTAAAIKLFPAALVAYLLVRDRRSAAVAALVGGIGLGVPLAIFGMDALLGYVDHSRRNLAYWETYPAVTYSLHGMTARLFVGGAWAEPLMEAPALGRGIVTTASIVLIAMTALLTVRTRTADASRDASVFSAWCALLVMLNPLSMGHNGVLLALPLALTGAELMRNGTVRQRVLWMTATIFVSVPRQALVAAGSPPTDALGSLVLAVPLVGCLLLYAASVDAASSPSAGAQSISPALSAR